jgi:hypothetical protein
LLTHGFQGIPKYYFMHTSPADIARHVLSLQAAKQLAKLSGRPFDVTLNLESEASAMFATTSNVSSADGKAVRIKPNSVRSPALHDFLNPVNPHKKKNTT